MSRRIVDLDEPDRFVAGAIGDPGDRSFYLTAAKGPRVLSVVLEREQLEVLAERVLAVVDELERRGLTAIDAGLDADRAAYAPKDAIPADFHVGTLAIAWDEDVDHFVVEARSHIHDEGAGETASPAIDDNEDEIPDDAPIGPDILRVRLKPLMALQFARQAARVVAAGAQR